MNETTELLARAGRLLLEYNESTGEIHRVLEATARVLTPDACRVSVSYNGVAVSLGGDAPRWEPVHELRYNTAVQARVHEILEQVRERRLAPSAAIARLNAVESDTPKHPRWVAVLTLAAAAGCLAAILGADAGGAAVAAFSSGLGLLARQELGRRHARLLTLPFTAAGIGAVLGGIAIRWGWSATPELVLIVPALMIVPGPHLINGLLDLSDNHLPMSLARLGLAVGILLASALGIVLGVELTLPGPLVAGQGARTGQLNLAGDMLLAAVVTCGFAVFYNTGWKHVALAALGGMAGHGLRFLALQAGGGLVAATFLGSLAVGTAAAWMSRSQRLPVAVIAVSGAVTMMPGLHMYRALAGAVQLARLSAEADPAAVAQTMGNAIGAFLVVCALALGLVLGARATLAISRAASAAMRSP